MNRTVVKDYEDVGFKHGSDGGVDFYDCNTTKTGSNIITFILQDTPCFPPACSHIWCLNIYNLQPKIEICLCSEAVIT